MESEMVEKVARAICIASGEKPDEDWRSSGGVMLTVYVANPARWTRYAGQARAAIEAMREPTWAMKEAQMALLRVLIEDPHERDQHAFVGLKAHRAMISAALVPPPGETE